MASRPLPKGRGVHLSRSIRWAGLRAMIDAAVECDAMGVGAPREGDTVRFAYPAVVLVAAKGGDAWARSA
jgi:hypothetical protein